MKSGHDDLVFSRRLLTALASLASCNIGFPWTASSFAPFLRSGSGRCDEASLLEDPADDLRHRGVICLKNLVTAPDPVGGRGREKVKAANGSAVSKEALKDTKNLAILRSARGIEQGEWQNDVAVQESVPIGKATNGF
ncbi:uncharacterized protein J3D65DRAFT_602107 [Phyllosticta citribraziliensis]|uniref:Uncharacterized protein n=1 Tax=Phyllosticta citribraziliensis TaxID=989973 RepID=A0ABR1LTE3_9PEZI